MLYTTKDVAKMLGVDNWRIKNFSEGGTYGLPPAIHVGRGRGSRRLYDWAGVCRMLIADELVEHGFTSESVGSAIREIPESKLIGRDCADSDYEVLLQIHGKWRVVSKSVIDNNSKRNTLIVVPFQQLIHDLHTDLRRKSDDEFLQREFPEVWREENPED
jgi:hypothetical protein